MTDLVSWLREQIAEDRRLAEEADGAHWYVTEIDGSVAEDNGYILAIGTWGGSVSGGDHMVRWSPARVLAECEAKERIVNSFAAAEQPLTTRTAEFAVIRMVLRLLALPYSDRPGYRQEWKP